SDQTLRYRSTSPTFSTESTQLRHPGGYRPWFDLLEHINGLGSVVDMPSYYRRGAELNRSICSSTALASFRTGVLGPSVNQLEIGASRSRASSRLPWPSHRRVRLVAARTSDILALCLAAIVSARR